MVHTLVISKDENLRSFLSTKANYTFTFFPPENTTEKLKVILKDNQIEAVIIDLCESSINYFPYYTICIRFPVLTIADPKLQNVITEVLDAYETQLLLKDSSSDYFPFILPFLRKAMRDKDKDLSTLETFSNAQKRYQDLLEAIPDIVYKLDPRGRFVYLNNAISALGYSSEELIGKHFSVLLHDEDIIRSSKKSVLPFLQGKILGEESAPKLFDERRTLQRATRGLEVQLKKKQKGAEENQEDLLGSIISYGEISATGQYTKGEQRQTFLGTVGIIRDITFRKKSEHLLRLFSVVLEQNQAGICIFEITKKIVYTNPYFIKLHSIPYPDVEESNLQDFWALDFPSLDLNSVINTVKREQYWHTEYLSTKSKNEEKWYSLKMYPISVFGDATHIVFFQEDITKRKQAEHQVKHELEEKTVLLQEVHHRVKNNLTIVSSLLKMQADNFQDSPEINNALLSSMSRVRAMALVHQKLYSSTAFSKIDIKDFIETICREIRSVYTSENTLSFTFEVDEIETSIAIAIPLGLILNEVITNAIKHAFTEKNTGSILVSFKAGKDEKKLIIIDNGCGFPYKGTNDNTSTLGMKLIHALTGQLQGHFSFQQDNGTEFTLIF
ncbi:MAG: histidine kinase dimerization/phosphoacceptor domain -containing protein [Spirochaetia bacterium]